MPRSGQAEFVIRFRGGNFENWKAAFDKHEPQRIRHGAVGHWIARSIDDPHEFIAVVEFTSVGGARGYASDPDRLDVQEALLIEGGPHNKTWDEHIAEVVDRATYPG
jgi:hypothetical protein